MHGDIVYIELSLDTQKVSETLTFYQTLFGWVFTESHLSSTKYFMFKTKGNQFQGALDENVVSSRDGVQMYIECNDIKSILETITKVYLTAEIVKPKTFISKQYGSYALIIDPSGNRIGLQENPKSD